jgi:predicted DNA-binding transcriptional regulator YafY
MDPLDNGHQRLRATVPDTAQIRWWLLGLGDNVEVIAPASLREAIRDRLSAALDAYQ